MVFELISNDILTKSMIFCRQREHHEGGSGYLKYMEVRNDSASCTQISHESSHPLTCVERGGVADATVVTPIVGEAVRRDSGSML